MSSHPHRTIRPYHGELPKKVKDVLDFIACPNEDENEKWDGTWFYDGSLDELYEELSKVGAMFFAYPDGKTEDNIVFVTHHNSWGAR